MLFLALSAIIATSAGRLAQDELLLSLHWNIHYECFRDNKLNCAKPAMSHANEALLTYRIDFAGFIEIEDSSYSAPIPYESVGGEVCKKGYTDWAQIVYNSSKWSPIGESVSGCLPTDTDDARAYVIQSFARNTNSSLVVTVASVHMVHPKYEAGDPQIEYKAALTFLKETIESLPSQHTSNFLFLSDTNVNLPGEVGGMSNQELYRGLGFEGTPSVESELFNSCCAHSLYPQAGKSTVNQTWAADSHHRKFRDTSDHLLPARARDVPLHPSTLYA